MKNPYEVLSVPQDADDKAIKDAYRKLARKYHPDVNPDDETAEERFKEIQGAHDVLSDPKKRQAWDRFGEGAFNGTRSASYGPPTGGIPSFEDIFGSGAFGDIFSTLFGGSQAPGGRRGGPGRGPGRRAVRGQDLEGETTISFHDAFHGTEREISVRREVLCGPCGGRGAIAKDGAGACEPCGGSGRTMIQRGALRVATACPSCRGTGQAGDPCGSCSGGGVLDRTDSVRFRVPPGIADGSRLRVQGRGNEGPGGAGDLYLRVRISSDPRFTRSGSDVNVVVPVSLSEAALGAEIPVPTMDGETIVRIPAGTPSGRRVRLSGRGFPKRKGQAGDLYAEIKIVPPPEPNDATRELLERLAEVSEFNPRATTDS